jgi:YhcN/YlaJ family sporulation lipoprotein
MNTNRSTLLISVGLLLAGLIGLASACGRVHRQGASEINQHLSASPIPYSNVASPTPGGTTGMNSTQMGTHGIGNVTASPTPAATGNPSANAAGGDRIDVSQSLADQIAAMNEVKTANVMVAGRTAFVAVTLHYGAGTQNGAGPGGNPTIVDVSDQLKTKIADKVKSSGQGIDNVFVSANPDFVERINAYSQDVRNGKPVSGFIKEFYNMVERMFPYRPAAANPPASGAR